MTLHPKLWEIVAAQFPMGRSSHHGPLHWRRVLENGLRLAKATGADEEIVELFAIFHDSRRVNDSIDAGHGRRGAELALTMHGEHFSLTEERLALLLEACRGHTDRGIHKNPTVGTCWDSDRLDLWRVGIYPSAKYLCTEEARRKEIIEWAVKRSRGG